MSYYTKITKAGLAAITAAMNNNTKVPITYMAFGDGNGDIPEPDEDASSLVNEVYRVGLNKVEVHSKNPNWLVCEAIIPSAVGGFNIREVALYDNTGNTMLAIASYPPTYKPTVEEGAAKIQTIRIVVQVDNTGNFELLIDPDIVLATAAFVNDRLKEEINSRIFSVKSFGAKGSTADNEIDCGDALIAAIQACSDAGGGEVFFDPLPSGMYYASTLRSQLTNINNVKINGNKQKLYTINPEITAKGSRSPFYINTGDNLEVFGFYFDGRYEDYVSKSKRINSHNFAGEHLSNVKIYHNVFANCGYPNDTIDEAGDSIYIVKNSHDIDIFENIFINPARWSISFQYNTDDLRGISIRNNFQYITRPNKSLGFIDLEFSSSALATQISNILIENNTAYFSGYIAMSNASFKDVTIRNNKLKGYTYGANRVYKSTDYPYGFGMLIQPDTGRLPLENIEILDNTFDSVNKQNIEITFQSKNMVVRGNKFLTQPDAPASCGFSKGIVISNAIDVEISGNSILGTANQPAAISLSVTNSTGSVYDNVAKHAVATSPTSFSAAASGELCVYDNYLETQNPTFQFSIGGGGVLFWGNTTPVGTSGRISSNAVVKFYGKNNTKLNANYNAQITNKFFAGQGDLSIAYESAAPNTGTWKVGDIVYNTNPSSGGVLGWSCVTSGTPGAWMPFGVLGVQKLTTANLQSAAHAANTTNKFAGKSVINSTDGKLYYADGSASTDPWKSADGSATITPQNL